MNNKKMFLSLVPWVIFSVVINRRGVDAAAIAALAAAAMSVVLIATNSEKTGVKIIDVTGVATFGALAAIGFAGDQATVDWIADYGRGSAALVLAAVMLFSAISVPFTEQYARESVPREYWSSPTFRAVNRKISAMWGFVALVMGAGHLLAGVIDPASDPVAGARPIDLLLNWGVPIALILWAVKQTQSISDDAGRSAPAPAGRVQQPGNR